METLVLQPTSTALWHSLVNEAEYASQIQLSESLESYLVFLLMRFSERPELVKSVLALEFLDGVHAMGSMRTEILREVGDKCLLFSGLFPGLAKRRRLEPKYFIHLGQNAYYNIANLNMEQWSDLYGQLCEGFVPMRNVLHAIRSCKEAMPDPVVELLSKIDTQQNSSLFKLH